MLVLSRQLHECIVLPTLPATIQIVALTAKIVRLGVQAPRHVPVFREEILSRAGVVASQFLALSAVEMQLQHNQRVLRQRLEILTRRLDLLRRQLGDAEVPGLHAMLQSIEEELRQNEELLSMLLLPPASPEPGSSEAPYEAASSCFTVEARDSTPR